MNKVVHNLSKKLPNWIYFFVSMVILTIPLCFGLIFYYKQKINLKNSQNDLSLNKAILDSSRESFKILKNENQKLLSSLDQEQIRNNLYEAQISSISSTVGILYKLSQTDKELLQKYSNVYFLNENYIPSQLTQIESEYLYRKEKPESIHLNIKKYLEQMLSDAKNASTTIFVFSAYRSFDTQASIKAGYKITYGSGANKFSADQGYSEHQLGSTVDLTTPIAKDNLNSFEKTDAFKWLNLNAYKYGFTLSYPKGNRFFQFEPWHWRYVGITLATKLHNEGKYFYDLDQRDINQYLINIFD